MTVATAVASANPQASSPAACAPLTERALLVALNIGEWRGRRRDREITHRVAREHGADVAAGCYTKALVPQSFLARIAEARTEARAVHHKLTLPWHDDGARILPVDLHVPYLECLTSIRTRFREAASGFLASYDDAKAAARATLGTLFREKDYPSPDRLRIAFRFEIQLQPLPAAHDWRIDLPDTVLERLRRDLQTRIEDAQLLARTDLYRRLAAVVSRMADTLAQPDKVFRNSLVGNVRDLCKLLPALNIAADPGLARLTSEVEDRLASLNPARLRDDPACRRAAADDAADLLATITDRLASYTGAVA